MINDSLFLNKITKTETCWLWNGCLDTGGYGRLRRNGKAISAHRYAWELANGHIPFDLFVLHTCDVRNCVNPGHLFLGNQSDNMRDREEKGRANRNPRKGEDYFGSKLSELKVKEIKERYKAGGVTMAELGREYGVSRPAVSLIISGRNWAHVV